MPRCDWYLNHIIPRGKQPAKFFFSLTYISVFGKNVFEGTRLLHIGVFIRHFANFRIFALDEFELFRVERDIVYHNQSLAIVPIAKWGLETGSEKKKFIMAEAVDGKEKIIEYILEFSKKGLEMRHGKKKGDKYYLETYLEYVKILPSEDCCVIKAKCYRSTRKTETPHS